LFATSREQRLLSRAFIVLLLSIDALMIGFDLLLWYTNLISSELFSISRDRGYAEFFQYVKELWIVVLFAWHALRTRERPYFFWSIVFAYVLLDDALTIHEEVGYFVRSNFEIPPLWGLTETDYAEFGYYILLGGTLLLLLGVVYRRGTAAFRQDSRHLISLLILFAIFGGIVDMLHNMVGNTVLFRVFGALEDGGEMVVMSFITWFAFLLMAHAQSPDHVTTQSGLIRG
jgi:hypothetical protein